MPDSADTAVFRSDLLATPLVSVIMPVYNSEEYVADALKNLLDQDFDRFEIIAVDDGSTDDSGAPIFLLQVALRSSHLRTPSKRL